MRRRARGHEEGWLLSYADLITNLLLFFVVLLSAANISKSKMQQITKAISGEPQPESLESIQQQIEKAIVDKNLQEVVQTKLKDDGLELSLNSGFVFDSGRALLRPEFETPLSSMLQVLLPHSTTYNFAVEGHTPTPRRLWGRRCSRPTGICRRRGPWWSASAWKAWASIAPAFASRVTPTPAPCPRPSCRG
jgi:flagellar motor protein MotB